MHSAGQENILQCIRNFTAALVKQHVKKDGRSPRLAKLFAVGRIKKHKVELVPPAFPLLCVFYNAHGKNINAFF